MSHAGNNKEGADSVIDIYADTWVATDGLGRVMPTAAQNPLRTDKKRTAGIFYITWHTQNHHKGMKSPYGGDVTRTLKQDPQARFQAHNQA